MRNCSVPATNSVNGVFCPTSSEGRNCLPKGIYRLEPVFGERTQDIYLALNDFCVTLCFKIIKTIGFMMISVLILLQGISTNCVILILTNYRICKYVFKKYSKRKGLTKYVDLSMRPISVYSRHWQRQWSLDNIVRPRRIRSAEIFECSKLYISTSVIWN